MEANNNTTTPPASDSDTMTSPSSSTSHDDALKLLLSTQVCYSPCAKESNSQNLATRWNKCPECDLKKKKRCSHHKLIAKRVKPGIACYKCNLSKKRCEGVPCIRCRSTGQQCKAQINSRKIRTSDRWEYIHAPKVDANAFSIHGASPTTSTQIALDKSTKIPSPGSQATTDERIQAPFSTADKLDCNTPPTSTLNFIIYEGSTQPTRWQSTNEYDVNQLLKNNSELIAHRQVLELEMHQLRLRNKELEDANQKMRNHKDELIELVTEIAKPLKDLILSKRWY